MTAIELIKARLPNGNKAQAELFCDQYVTSPRGQYDNLGAILISPHKAHWVAASPDAAVDTSIPLGNSPREHWENLRREQLQLKKSDIAISYPISKFEHGGEIRLSLGGKSGCWDNDVVGFIYVTKPQVRTWYGVERITKSITEHAKACLKSEVDLLTAWLNGECCEWQVKEYALDADGLGWEVVGVLESRWGYFDQAQASCDMKDMLITICQSANP